VTILHFVVDIHFLILFLVSLLLPLLFYHPLVLQESILVSLFQVMILQQVHLLYPQQVFPLLVGIYCSCFLLLAWLMLFSSLFLFFLQCTYFFLFYFFSV